MSNTTVNPVDEFFRSYRDAFDRSDASGIVRHFACPSHVTSDRDEIALVSVLSQEQWLRQIDQLLGAYAKIGVSSANLLD